MMSVVLLSPGGENLTYIISIVSKSYSLTSELTNNRDTYGLCRMTLLLGPPSSGKTTLLLALAGKLGLDLKVRERNLTR